MCVCVCVCVCVTMVFTMHMGGVVKGNVFLAFQIFASVRGTKHIISTGEVAGGGFF